MNRNAYIRTHELLSALANERVHEAREIDDTTDRLLNFREGLNEMVSNLNAMLANLQKKREELMVDTPPHEPELNDKNDKRDDMAKPHGGSPIPQNSET